MTRLPNVCPDCGFRRRWSGPSHAVGCPRRLRISTDELEAHRTWSRSWAHPTSRYEPHEVCKTAMADGGVACSRCTVYLCGDEECSHEACQRDRWLATNDWAW